MTTPDPIRSAFDNLALKEMDAAALVFAIENAATTMSLPGENLRLAMEVATIAHLDQSRKNGIKSNEDPYIVHPLRNVLRLIRYGCSDIDVLSATALHDTVEDRPRAVIGLLGGHVADDAQPRETRRQALELIAGRFGHKISELVAAVTNPISDAPGGHTTEYQNHVIGVISDPAVFLVKFSDFVDNAGSVKYLDKVNGLKLATKYEALVEPFRQTALTLGGALNLPQSGLDGISDHLTAIDADIKRLRSESS